MTIIFSPAPTPISPPKAPKLGVRKINKQRAKNEFARCYHSRARQKFVNLRPCAACDVWGYSQNAHVLGNDGASRKGSYKTIAALCTVRPDGKGGVWPGCHHLHDREYDKFRALFPTFSATKAARECERAWQTFLRDANEASESRSRPRRGPHQEGT